MKIVCAWCGVLVSEANDGDDRTSHCICPPCTAEVLADLPPGVVGHMSVPRGGRAGKKLDEPTISQADVAAWAAEQAEYEAKLGEDPYYVPPPPVAAGVVCKCPADFCPAHGRLSKAELRHGRRTRG